MQWVGRGYRLHLGTGAPTLRIYSLVVEQLEILIDNGADVNAEPSNYGGRTPLQEAAECGYTEIVGLLLSEGALVNAEPSTV